MVAKNEFLSLDTCFAFGIDPGVIQTYVLCGKASCKNFLSVSDFNKKIKRASLRPNGLQHILLIRLFFQVGLNGILKEFRSLSCTKQGFNSQLLLFF